MSQKYKINPFTGILDRVLRGEEFESVANVYSQLKPSVNTYNDLPVSGNAEGDMRVTLDTDKIYTWSISASSGNLTDWAVIGSVTSIPWGNITGTLSNQTDLQSALNGKANTSHTHAISDVTDLQSTLDDKADKLSQQNAGETTVLLPFDGIIEDKANNTTYSLEGGATFQTNSSQKGTGNVDIPNSSAHIQVPYRAEFDIFDVDETRDFTLEFWARQYSDLSGYLLTFGTDLNNFWGIDRGSGDGRLEAWKAGVRVVNMIANPGVPVNGTWYHVAVIRVNGIYSIYYNGIQKGYYAGGSTGEYGSSSVLKIGTRPNNTDGWVGDIDEFRFSWGNVYGAVPISGLGNSITSEIDFSNQPAEVLKGIVLAGINSTDDLIRIDEIDNVSLTNSIESNIGRALDSDPDDPADNKYVIWQSTGVGSGNAGDLMIKINDNSTVTTHKLLSANDESILTPIENADIDVGTEVVDSFADTLATSAIWYYRVKEGNNFRSGKIVAVWDAATDTINFTHVSTQDIGDTSALTLQVVINSNNVELQATLASGANYQVKGYRQIL